ncbi:VWA domain-containing protein [Streptomyces sp. VNUA74]|uniref:VWA domain-containing protein n=1 Tax=Streptomyces sp. VNUA74 TaxID=3062685 RepID=UPI00280A59C8|nr:VWA domain-containing protein [Streptomyces sp. VNUA74]WML81463.1 VWA domain-containing protein [Streptomyces sp. VNUA74]
MGILTLLRNAFGRSRKEQTAPAEGATQETAPPATAPEPKLPSQPTAPAEPPTTQVPEPRSEPTPDEHDLVKAAFTNINVPKPTPEPTPDPKPEAEAKSEAEPAPEPTPEPEAKPKADAKPEPEPTPEPEAEPKAKAEPETNAEPKAEPEAKAEPSTPAAADGEDAPQGPPAPDNESSTGGAGGNKDSEGEAEETTHPEPKAPAEETTRPEPEAPAEETPRPEPEAPATPKPATPAARIKSRAPALTTAYKAAATTLKTHDLTGTRAKVHLVLDRSASMRPYYKDGSAQALAEQTLALAAHLDPEATVHVTFFSTELDGTGDLTLTDHENKIDELHAALGRMGRTSYHAAVEAVLAHHEKEAPGTPALVVFQTDGAPDAKTPATQALTDAAANHPDVHFSFVAFGDPENKAFDYLRKLKTGNTSHFLAGETPKELTDEELYEGVLATWRP